MQAPIGPGGVELERGPLRGTGDFPVILIDETSGNGRSRLVARPLRGWQLRILGQHQIGQSLARRENAGAIDDNCAMPAVAFVIPPNTESGHPASSTVSRYEAFLRKLIDKVRSNPEL